MSWPSCTIPDKWPNGSAEQVAAAERMREINAAYDLIEDAPLQHREIPVEPTHAASRAPSELAYATRDRPGQVPIRRLGGRSSLVYWLSSRGLMQDLYSWLVAIVMGIVFARTTWISNRLLEGIVGWLPR